MSKLRTAIGLMSGTSMDGIDLALVRTDGLSYVERLAFTFFPYEASVRELLASALEDAKAVSDRNDRPGVLERAEEFVTKLHIKAVLSFLKEHKISSDDIDLLGFHGQTVLHRPDKGLTIQLGNGQVLANGTGITTVYDMRANDIRFGGQGAPLIPAYHKALAANVEKAGLEASVICFVNIGGISNITCVGKDLVAFDTGPGNSLIDQWVEKYVGISHDQGGMIAAEGRIDAELVGRYMNDPFFSKPVPKSLDRNDFQIPEESGLGVETVARSLANVTARSILRAVDHLPEKPDLWIICGGGRHNPHIMHDLKTLASADGMSVISAEEAGFDGDAMEAEGWAYLAVRAVGGAPLTFPKTTGCDKAVSGGVICKPRKD